MGGSVRVLYVDGDDAFREETASAVERANDRLRIETASTATTGIDRLTTESFDCVLAAYELTDETGLDLLDRVRTAQPAIPFVLLAGSGSEQLASDAIAAGVTDYIPKKRVEEQPVQLSTRILDVFNRRVHRNAETDHLCKAIDKAHTPLVLTDPTSEDNPLVYVNEAFEAMTGYSEAELVGRNCRLLQGEKTNPETVAELRTAIDEEKPVTVEMRNYRNDGTMFWNQLTVVPVYDADGELVRYLGTQQDITERKQRAQELKQYERLVDNLPVGVVRTTPGSEGAVRLVNEAMVELFDAPSKTAIRESSVAELYADPADRARFSDRLEAEGVIRNEELRMETFEGEQIWCAVSAVAVSQNDETIFEIAIQDITERKRYEHDLSLFKQAVEQAGNSVLITARDGTIEYVNPAFERTTGYDAEEVIGKTPRVLKSEKHDEEFYADLWETILAGEIWEGELINRRKSGQLYHVSHMIAPITDESGDISHFVGIQSDITDQKLREKRLSELTRILRHNLRNRVTALKGHAETLEDAVPEERQPNLSYILAQADELASTSEKATKIRKLLDRELGTDGRCDIQAVLADLETELQRSYPEADLTIESESADVGIDSETCRSLIRELVDNAVVHNDRETPEVTVKSSGTENGQIQISVADNGPGIPAQERMAVTVDPESPLEHGSGIGLSHVHMLVTEYGGDIQITENEPRGTVVAFSLPRAE